MQPAKHPYNPWYKATYPFDRGGIKLSLRVPHDVFSTQRIDEGTLLLLDHLAPGQPKKILDMGCGYGALGLPIAAKYPAATLEMVDRDLLAVAWSEDNARTNQLSNVKAYGSLGFRNVPVDSKYDWILCNVPARIGRPFIKNLIEGGRARLLPEGDLRLVVINDLCPTITELARENQWPAIEVKRGPRHTVYSFAPSSASVPPSDDEKLYTRDEVEFGGIKVSRPFDLGGDDPKRLSQGLPLLLDAFPRDPKYQPERVLCFRVGYGLLPLQCRQKWPNATVVASDRDLLGTYFTELNALRYKQNSGSLEIRERAHFPDAIANDEPFQLILGELSPSAGEQVLQAELKSIIAALAPGGQAYLLCLEKIEKDWVKPYAEKNRLPLISTIKRSGYSILHSSKNPLSKNR